MNAVQNADVMMFRNLASFLAQNASILNQSALLKEDVMDFQQNWAQLEAKITAVNTIPEITGQEKRHLRAEIIQESIRYLGFLHRHAFKNKDPFLKKMSDVKPSTLKQMSDPDFLNYCNQMSELLPNYQAILATALVPVSEQRATLEKIARFKTVKPQVQLNITQKAIQNEDIDLYIRAIKTILKEMLDVSVQSLENSEPELVREYGRNRQRRQPNKATPKPLIKKIE
jgi:hypothetical protein